MTAIEETKPKQFLNDICVIRIILILLLITYHSLCPYTASSSWDNPQGYDIPLYYWIGRLSYSCMLETFVLISGVILGYQTERKGREALSFNYMVMKKFKRLIVPSLIFGTIYFLIFLGLSSEPSFIIKSILRGAGHMWFLPMLFLCFFALFIIGFLGLDRKEILPLLLLFAIFSSIPFSLLMSQSMYYFFFFFLGYCIGSKQIDFSRFINKRTIIGISLLFLITFPVLAQLRYGYDEIFIVDKMDWDIPLKFKLFIAYSFQHLCQLTYSTIGVFLFYISVNYMIRQNLIKVSPLIVKLSSYCFGVYIFQEFIIKIFYYKLYAIETLNPYVFPLASVIISLILSVLFTHLSLKTKIGKLLIG